MIIWGSRGKIVDLGERQTCFCQVCGQNRQFHVELQYRYFHLYYLFGVVTGKQYFMLCDICRRGWKLEPTKVEPRLERNPIPFMQRFGLASFAIVVVTVGSMATFLG